MRHVLFLPRRNLHLQLSFFSFQKSFGSVRLKKPEKPSNSVPKYCDHLMCTVIERENSNRVKNLFISIYANLYFTLSFSSFNTFHFPLSRFHPSLVTCFISVLSLKKPQFEISLFSIRIQKARIVWKDMMETWMLQIGNFSISIISSILIIGVLLINCTKVSLFSGFYISFPLSHGRSISTNFLGQTCTSETFGLPTSSCSSSCRRRKCKFLFLLFSPGFVLTTDNFQAPPPAAGNIKPNDQKPDEEIKPRVIERDEKAVSDTLAPSETF